jgi:hypothetical protein
MYSTVFWVRLYENLFLSNSVFLHLNNTTFTVRNQEAGQPGKLATDFLQLVVLHEISKKLYRWKA